MVLIMHELGHVATELHQYETYTKYVQLTRECIITARRFVSPKSWSFTLMIIFNTTGYSLQQKYFAFSETLQSIRSNTG